MLASIQQRLKIACAIGIPSLACLLVPKIFNQTISSMSTEARGLYSMAYVTIDKEESAKILAKQIVSSKLAACVNIVPKITSVYEWEGKLNEDGESLMIIKTKTSHVDDLVAFVKANHPYEVCEVITTLIDKGNPDYLSWISETVPEKNAVETGHSNNDVNSVSVIGNQDNAANGENMELVLNSTDIPKTQSSEKKKKKRRGAKKKRVTKKSKLKQNLASVEFKVKCLDFLNNTTINDTGNQHNVANMNAENTEKMPNLADILSWVPQSTLKNQKNSTPPQKLTTQEFKKKFLEFLNVNPINIMGNQHNKGKGENAGLVLNLADIPCSSSQSIPSAVETPHLNNDINTISVTRIQDNAANRKNTGHELDPAKIPITQSHLKKKKKKKPKKKITRAVRLQNWKLAEFKKRYFECFNNNTQNDTENPKNVANGEDTGLVSNLVDGPSGTTQPALINKNNFASQQNWSAEEFKKNYLELLNDKLTNVIRNQHDGANGKNTGHVLNLADIPSSASQSIPSAVETAHLNIDNNSVSVTGIQDNAANRENSGHGLNHADIPKTESPSKKKKRKRKKNKDRRSLYARLKKLAFQESKRNRLKPANYNPINVIKNQDNAANGENTGLVTNLADIPSSSSQSIQSAVETPCVNNDINTASVVGNQDNAANGENMGHVSNLADIPSSSSQLIQNTVETPRLNNDINTVSVIGNQDNAANGENMVHVSNLADIPSSSSQLIQNTVETPRLNNDINTVSVIGNQDNAANGENMVHVSNLADIPSSSSQLIQNTVETPRLNNDINTVSVIGNQDNAANGENMGHVSNLADIPSSSSQLIQNTVETPRLNNDINTVSVIGNQDNAANGENMEHVSNLTDINILTQSNLINEENSAPPQS